jgi:hypothetical protein
MTQARTAARRRLTQVRPILYLLLVLMTAGCASSGTTLAHPNRAGGHVIYRISEQQAFTIALEAYAALYPKQSVDDIVEGARRGYNADERAWVDWWSHRLFVVPAIGIDTGGTEVRGYWYDYKGSGSLAPTEKRTTGLLNLIRSRLDATGTAVVVTNLRDGTYETDGRAYLGLKRDARDIKLAPRSSGSANAERLRELNTLRDRGLISEEEYQAKRRQILDRM